MESQRNCWGFPWGGGNLNSKESDCAVVGSEQPFPAGNRPLPLGSEIARGGGEGMTCAPVRLAANLQAQPSAQPGRHTEAKARSAPTPAWPAAAFRPSAHDVQAADVSSALASRPCGATVTAAGRSRPRPRPLRSRPIRTPWRRDESREPRPHASAYYKWGCALPAAQSGSLGSKTIMQSAMFLAVQHDCGSMDTSAGNGPKSEEKRENMKRTL